jgi:hypothetical protein
VHTIKFSGDSKYDDLAAALEDVCLKSQSMPPKLALRSTTYTIGERTEVVIQVGVGRGSAMATRSPVKAPSSLRMDDMNLESQTACRFDEYDLGDLTLRSAIS